MSPPKTSPPGLSPSPEPPDWPTCVYWGKWSLSGEDVPKVTSKEQKLSNVKQTLQHEVAQMVGMREKIQAHKEIFSIIDSLKKQIVIDRCVYIEKRMKENKLKLVGISNHLYKLSMERTNDKPINIDESVDLLKKRQKDAIDMQNGIVLHNGDEGNDIEKEDGHASSAILLGSSIAIKNAVCAIPLIDGNKRLPPYTTWIFLARNQQMSEDQSIVGRGRIYYDKNSGEALICDDSDEEIRKEEEDKEFGDSEDYIIRLTIKAVGLSDAALDALAQCCSRKPCEIKERYKALINGGNSVEVPVSSFLDKDLDAALDSFDHLFCRRCLDLIFPAEKQLPWSCSDDETKPCGLHCYKLEKYFLPADHIGAQISWGKSPSPSGQRRIKSCQNESAPSTGRNISGSSDSDSRSFQDITSTFRSMLLPKSNLPTESGICKKNNQRVTEHILPCTQKRQKKAVPSVSSSSVNANLTSKDMVFQSITLEENEDDTSPRKHRSLGGGMSERKESPTIDSQKYLQQGHPHGPLNEIISEKLVYCDDALQEEGCACRSTHKWKTIEKALYEKGLEIFGWNSCLIARNLMNGMKTCLEVYLYMSCSEKRLFSQTGDGVNPLLEGHSKVNEVKRSRILRRRGKARRLKYTWKSAGYHPIRKQITEMKDELYRNYSPCGCQSVCEKQCPCVVNGTCCEKYCGCPRICKNRFRGCHCAKSQCQSRQCPCFAAGRECDPDVCRNCWVSCGDYTLGIPSQRGDNYECRNMKLLLKQQQRVLLGRSDVSGWGAFLKNNVDKHEYLGEYTGELISHEEADKRGQIYDLENFSFLFDLNDQFVLDAYRKGDKLKFANHSPDPNCYAKVIMVAGDHRVGIFAKRRISAGEELFYDYRYKPDSTPAWARKLLASSCKRDSASASGRAKKRA
ncbi:histone-lysine N-methyltransferase CLF-like isoform X2 [Diospyros lotus]|uniref:histone-lysine N-methyltransferase CLF-like isoform X2 n=1 Tax=Diospyros lotus TaxID=55363 RepID=UPI00225C23D5|nr:histone-lysine N-methyltransferase CLF-like isoform X2 [Diospyros lotus]